MSEQEMSMNEILTSIRETLSQELSESPSSEQLDEELEDIFILTPEMRCDEVKNSLEEKMQRVLQKITEQSQELKKKTAAEELQPLLKEWMERMRPDLSKEAIIKELEKIFPNT